MKKLLALLLVAAMVLGMGVTAFAASSTYKIVGFEDGMTLGSYIWFWAGEGPTLDPELSGENTRYYSGEIAPMDEAKDYLYIDIDMFEWEDGNKPSASTPTGWDYRTGTTTIRNSRLAVRSSFQSGSKVIKEIKLDPKEGRIEIEYITELVSTGKVEFEFLIYLTIDGKQYRDEGVTFIGTMKNPEINVFKDYDFIDLGEGYVAIAQDFVPKIQVDIGNGVSIFTKFFKDKKYYGITDREPDEANDVVFKKYPDIDNVLKLKVVGLNSTGDVVKLSTDYAKYYVYDKDLNFIGMANEMLPFSTTYYLANKKLDIKAE